MSFKYANLYVDEGTYEEWKTLCDEQGINYGPRVTILMKKDIKILKAMKGTTEQTTGHCAPKL